ncbi:MAG TPA: transglutaminase-like domain-containing protein [Aggregatilineales bacterium]|nr:transglutaminase-like domain-containing protein [Aggregatilineales bacterium]
MALDVQAYYAEPGVMTDLSRHGDMLVGLPHDIGELCKVVQGVMVHVFWANAYGMSETEIAPRRAELQLRAARHLLNRIRELDPRPLAIARPLRKRILGNCRDFTVLLVALLRYQGIPARARCGFGTYFTPGKREDHWVAEVWREDEGRWVLVDA